jgi:hypothetical protein
MSLTNQRELFEIPDQITYLNCAYMSPLLRAAREAGQVAIARKSTPWRIAARATSLRTRRRHGACLPS